MTKVTDTSRAFRRTIPSTKQTAERLRLHLGHFAPIRVAAKHAARIGQCFSTTVATVRVSEGREWRRRAPDVERGGFCFSDGCGTVIPALAEEMWARYREAAKAFQEDASFPRSFFSGQAPGGADAAEEAQGPAVPSAFQIRLGGCKGMVSLDVRGQGRRITTRKSMDKFDAAAVRPPDTPTSHPQSPLTLLRRTPRATPRVTRHGHPNPRRTPPRPSPWRCAPCPSACLATRTASS